MLKNKEDINRRILVEYRCLAFLGFTFFPLTEYLRGVIYPNVHINVFLDILLSSVCLLFFTYTFFKNIQWKFVNAFSPIMCFLFLLWAVQLNIENDFAPQYMISLLLVIISTLFIINQGTVFIYYLVGTIIFTVIGCFMANIPTSEIIQNILMVVTVDIMTGFLMWSRLRLQKNLQSSLEVQAVLMKEIHHRVKNNLQMVSSMLILQESFANNKELSVQFKDARERILTISLLHEHLYQNDDFNKINFDDFIKKLLQRITGITAEEIDVSIESKNMQLENQKVLILGVIVNELVTNILKHAYQNVNHKKISIRFYQEKEKYLLEISHNGKGYDHSTNSEKPANATFGLRLIELLSKQLNGIITSNATNHGTTWQLEFS